MKKVLVTLIALSLPAFALADETKGFYVQADAGHATVKLGGASIKALALVFLQATISAISVLLPTIRIINLQRLMYLRYMLRLNITVPVYLLFMILTCKLL